MTPRWVAKGTRPASECPGRRSEAVSEDHNEDRQRDAIGPFGAQRSRHRIDPPGAARWLAGSIRPRPRHRSYHPSRFCVVVGPLGFQTEPSHLRGLGLSCLRGLAAYRAMEVAFLTEMRLYRVMHSGRWVASGAYSSDLSRPRCLGRRRFSDWGVESAGAVRGVITPQRIH
jgi:hypothetical protein